NTRPYSFPTTPESSGFSDVSECFTVADVPLGLSEPPAQQRPTFHIPQNLTQSMVEADPRLKRLQQDLLNLTSFNDNSTLRWRPSWFIEPKSSSRFWTLHNPLHVVTELLPQHHLGEPVMTRRFRRPGDAPPVYLKDWKAWKRYCDLYGVPYDFLCEDQVRLLRLGLPRREDGMICVPPSWPLYPEPQPFSESNYILDPDTYYSLPRKFH
ncbi:hypothetical protein K458DRAFT_269862, partial [Lentithecium fluviatile CBS 122367]